MTALALATLCAASYTTPPAWARSDVHVCRTDTDDGPVIAFRGSASIEDWLRDLYACPYAATDHPELGLLHAGFLGDVLQVAHQMLDDLTGDSFHVTGHSKGGAEASIFAAMCVSYGWSVKSLTTFGCPKHAALGNTDLTALLRDLDGADYRHRDDPVPIVPPGFSHPRPLVQLERPTFELNVISDHFIAAYIAALTDL